MAAGKELDITVTVEEHPTRILVYRIGHIGDTVVALPALWAIRRCFPDAHITLLCNRQPGSNYVLASAILPTQGLIDETLTYVSDENRSNPLNLFGLLRELRTRRYDSLVYLAPRLRSPIAIARDKAFFRLAGIDRFYADRGFGFPLREVDQSLPNVESEADHLLARLELTGIPVPATGEGEMNLAISELEREAASGWLRRNLPDTAREKKLVGMAPASKWPSKVWPEDRYLAFGRWLVEQGMIPMVVGGKEDAPLGNRLIAEWGAGHNAAGELDVRATAALLELCDFYFGNDTGAMHLAAAVGTPCVVVMSAQDWPGRWEPYGSDHIVLRKSVSCEGCFLRVCDREALRCLTSISVEDAIDACRKVVSRSRQSVERLACVSSVG